MKANQMTTRKFLGKTENFSDKQEQAFEKKHLKAYLNGDKEFRHGYYTNAAGQRVPATFQVKQKITVLKPKN